MNATTEFDESQFVDWTFGMTLAEFVKAASNSDSHTRQRMIGQLEGAMKALREAGLKQ